MSKIPIVPEIRADVDAPKKYARAYLGAGNASASIVPAAQVPIDFNFPYDDPFGLIIETGANWTFTADEDGIYDLKCTINVSANFDALGEDVQIRVDTTNLSGEAPSTFKQISEMQGQANTATENHSIAATTLLKIRAGETFNVYLVNSTSNNVGIGQGGGLTFFEIIKVSEIKE